MALGPVLRYELITTSRRPRYYWARLIYGCILLYILFQHANRPPTPYYMNQDPSYNDTQTSLRYLAESVFATIGGAQAMALLFLTPAMVAGVIADEARRKTLYDLFSSGLSSWSIVFGKLSSRMVHALVLMAIGVPIVALLELIGGLDPWIVAYVYAGTLTTVFAAASLSMLVSVLARSPREATLASYVLVLCWLFGPMFTEPILESSGWPMNSLLVVNKAARASNPLWMASALQNVADQEYSRNYWMWNQSRRGVAWPIPPTTIDPTNFHGMIGLQLGLGFFALFLSVVLLRPVRGFGDGSGSLRWKQLMGARFNERVRHSRVIYERSSCGDIPMLWKERRATHRGGLAWLAGRPLALIVIIIMGCFLFEAMVPAFRETLESLQTGTQSMHSRRYLNGMIRDMGMYVFMLWLIVVACAGAVSVTEEKESDTWISLTATLLTGREIILGKIFGALWSSQLIGLALLAMIGAGVFAGALHPLSALLAMLGLAIYGAFAATLGIAISLRAKNSPRAILWTISTLAIINIGILVSFASMGYRGSQEIPLIWSTVAPYMIRISMMLPSEFSLTGRHEIGLLWISYVLYGLAAIVLTHRTIRRFDMAVDRPRLSETVPPVTAIQPAS